MTLAKREQIFGGLWGSVVGDALGVPVEFNARSQIKSCPVTDMIGYGTHHQPAGTWSDDSSLMLCSMESLLMHEFDTEEMGRRFLSWYRDDLWTPHGEVFDIGLTTSEALSRIARGVRAEVAGADGQYSNGNGSLMRIIPVSLRFADSKDLLKRVHRASAITHQHPRSQMACGLYSLVVRELLAGLAAGPALTEALKSFCLYYEADPYWAVELDSFRLLLEGNIANRREPEIESSGYVIHTLTASLWCLLTTNSYSECVLKAVNLGRDTDTTGCVTGGLAGLLYGVAAIPERWREILARHDDLESLFDRFAELLVSQ